MDLSLADLITASGKRNPILVEKERKEHEKIERKRQMEEERKSRIFNTKSRLIGLDVSALNQQIQEKADRQRVEEIENEKQDICLQMLAYKALREETLAGLEKRRMCKGIDDYRQLQQKKKLSRDYDLEKLTDSSDAKCGNENGMHFEGEDVHLNERTKQQQFQLKTWLQLQMQERQTMKEKEKLANKTYNDICIEKERKFLQREEMEGRCRLMLESAVAEYNATMARKNAHEREQQRRNESQRNKIEIVNTLASDFMQETPSLAQSSLGPNRINPMMYKGMSEEQIKEIRTYQKKQMELKKAKMIAEQYEMKSWDNYNKQALDAVKTAELAKQRQIGTLTKGLEQFNEQLGRRQKEMERYRNSCLYANQVSDGYFAQFSKESR